MKHVNPAHLIEYKPPKTIKAFIRDYRPEELFYSWIVGPVGSGKTTALFMKLCYLATKQQASPDGIKRTRAVIVRNTMPQLKDTTLVSWGYWFKEGQAGEWNATDKIFTLRFGDCEVLVMFRPLDTADDVERVLSLELNFAIIDEFVQIPRAIVDALSGRLGRYKQPDGTPVTIWGMWGSSNPSTEDNWWHDYLHGNQMRNWKLDGSSWNEDDEQYTTYRARITILGGDPDEINATYFHQPSARSDGVENVENLPGKYRYYTNLMKGKSEIWLKQFIDAEWGFSITGQAVVSGFKADFHVAKGKLRYDPNLPLIIGLDPGITGSAAVFMQEDYTGRVNGLGELVQQGYGVKRLVATRILPYIKNRFPGCDISSVVIALDPAGGNRAQTDEKSAKKILTELGFVVECETNNRFPLRLAAYEHYTSTLAEGDYALCVDPVWCPQWIRALKGGWRYGADVKKEILKGAEPEKNPFSHVGDAGGYGLRYFHKGQLRYEKFGVKWKKGVRGPAQITKQTVPRYHWS